MVAATGPLPVRPARWRAASNVKPVWPAAVSARSVAALRGPALPARVLAAFPSALYLRTVDGVLPVVTVSGLRLPTSLTLATEGPASGWAVRAGDVVTVGAGEVVLPRLVLRAVRTWHPRRVPVAAPGALETCIRALPYSPWRDRARVLTHRLLVGAEVRREVTELAGAGPGLTPSGDDVLCGAMLGLRVRGGAAGDLGPALWDAVRPRLGSTTDLSAALLAEASQGYAVAPVMRLAEALVAGGEPQVAAAVAAVDAIGHSSGADLLAGLAGALDAVRSLPSPSAGLLEDDPIPPTMSCRSVP